MFVLGLTGPSGAGKSMVAGRLVKHGFALLDADAVSRGVTRPGEPCLAQIAAVFGEEYLLPDGSLDRKKLAHLVFSDKDSLERLNAVTHPHIMREIERSLGELGAAGCDRAVLDAPALYEAGAERLCTKVAAVIAPKELCYKRIMVRDGITPGQALTRLDAQPPQEFYTSHADFVIENDGDEKALEQAAENLASAADDNRQL